MTRDQRLDACDQQLEALMREVVSSMGADIRAMIEGRPTPRVIWEARNAARVAEADLIMAELDSDLALEKVTAPVLTGAHWVPTTKRALADAGQMRTLIDDFLRFGLEDDMPIGDES